VSTCTKQFVITAKWSIQGELVPCMLHIILFGL